MKYKTFRSQSNNGIEAALNRFLDFHPGVVIHFEQYTASVWGLEFIIRYTYADEMVYVNDATEQLEAVNG